MNSIVEIGKLRFFQITSLIALVFLALTIILPLWRLFPDVTQAFAIPLHYNIHSGVDSFGPWQRIFTIPIISGIILVLNVVVSVSLWRKDKVLSYMFASVAAIAQVLAFLAMVFVVLLNLAYA